ncbi:MAG: hypothetical protein R2753_05010 [Chitinophagales bacterium]
MKRSNKIKYFDLKWFYLLLIGMVGLSSCIDNKSAGPIGINPTVPNLTHPGLWIVNEGGFTFGQASLSFLDLVEDSMYNKVFEGINGRLLGDVFQSINFYKGKAYLTVNNSQKIEVVDSLTFESIATITGFNSPREIVGYQNKLFITDLYSNKMKVVDATTYAEMAVIETKGWTNKMLIHNDKLYVTVQQIFANNTPTSRKGLLIIDPITYEIDKYLALAQGANSLVLDKNNKLWVLCDGGLEEEIGGLFKIDPLAHSIETAIYFPSEEYSASSLQMNKAKDQLYFIIADPGEGIDAFDIMKMDINVTELPNETWFDGEQLYIYGFMLDEERDEFYFNNAVGLLQEGFCYKYRLSNQSFIEKYQTGIFPSELYIRN